MENTESKTPKKSATTSKTEGKTTKSTQTKSTVEKPSSTASKQAAASKSASSAKSTTTSKPKTSEAKPASSNSASPVKETKPTPKAKPATGVKSTNSSPIKNKSTHPVKSSQNPIKPGETKPHVQEIEQGKLNKDLIADGNEEEEKKKKKKILLILFFIILGLVLIGVAIYFILRIPKKEINFTVYIESEVTTTFEDEFGQIQHIEYLPGDLINGYLKIKVDDTNSTVATSENVFLRIKIGIEVDDNYYPGLFNPYFVNQNDKDNWYGEGAGEESPDNYLYYCLRCYDNDEIIAFNHLEFTLNAYNNVLNGKTGKLIFTVEILEGNFSAIGQEWYTAPDGWRTLVR